MHVHCTVLETLTFIDKFAQCVWNGGLLINLNAIVEFNASYKL